jgi:chemotaxis protein methyltransferase CheR
MALSRHLPLSCIRITATDIDKQVIAHAQVGLYSEKSISNVPEDLKKKYFTQVGKSYKIADEIKRCVTFKEHNLLKDEYPRGFDMILCRNVVIYFTDEAKNMIYSNFHSSLKDKGVLFIGSTEQIANYRELGFERMSSFYFEKA